MKFGGVINLQPARNVNNPYLQSMQPVCKLTAIRHTLYESIIIKILLFYEY